ncbi:hypothetical protein [Mycetocola reblochoni]|uniref:hypothetical protein n=1 Tax=Mycetocola reblochoni TaxID=331618 RepID=UPI003F9DBDC5
MYYRTAHAAAAVLGIAALALTGCAAGAEPDAAADSAPPAVEATAAPTPDPTEPAETAAPNEADEIGGTPAPEPEATPDAATCEQVAGEPNDPYASGGGSLGGLPAVTLQDIGARPGAQGDVTLDEEGVPASYTVAAGDNEDAIAERLCSTRDYLVLLNTIRRNTTTVETDVPWPQAGSRVTMMDLHESDTLNLNPYTIASTGDQNGQVYANNPDIPMPPQR